MFQIFVKKTIFDFKQICFAACNALNNKLQPFLFWSNRWVLNYINWCPPKWSDKSTEICYLHMSFFKGWNFLNKCTLTIKSDIFLALSFLFFSFSLSIQILASWNLNDSTKGIKLWRFFLEKHHVFCKSWCNCIV